ncbi:MAG: twin-arginine translocation signal domain-containing protein [Steroidobacteraceae bacterium]
MPPSITRRDFLQAASLLAAPGALAHAAEAPDVRAAPAAFAYA